MVVPCRDDVWMAEVNVSKGLGACPRPRVARCEALKALVVAQHERYTHTLSTRAGEIERLVLLVAKLKQMLFGRKEREGAAPDRAAGVPA